MTDELQQYREEIFNINEQLLDLLTQRGKVAKKLATSNANKELQFMTLSAKRKC